MSDEWPFRRFHRITCFHLKRKSKNSFKCTQPNTAFLLGFRVVEIHLSPENLLPSFILLFCHHHHKTIKSQRSSLSKSKVPHFIITVRKRSLGQGNVFTCICLSTGEVSVWCHLLSGCLVPRSFLGFLCALSHVPSRGSLFGGSMSRGSLSRVKNGWYTSSWNAFLLNSEITYVLRLTSFNFDKFVNRDKFDSISF